MSNAEQSVRKVVNCAGSGGAGAGLERRGSPFEMCVNEGSGEGYLPLVRSDIIDKIEFVIGRSEFLFARVPRFTAAGLP
jgi:hypothetical protein